MGFVMSRQLIAIDVEKLEHLASKGYSMAVIGKHLGMCRETLRNRFNDNSSILAAYKRGQAIDVQEVANVLRERAMSGKCLGALCFYLKNKDPDNWKEEQNVNHTGSLAINVASLKAPIDGQYSTIKSNT